LAEGYKDKEVRPANRFLDFCELGIKFPYNEDIIDATIKDVNFKGTLKIVAVVAPLVPSMAPVVAMLYKWHKVHPRMTNEFCPMVRGNVTSLQNQYPDDDFYANYWFCHEWPERNHVLKHETDYATAPGFPFLDNHHDMCNKFNKVHLSRYKKLEKERKISAITSQLTTTSHTGTEAKPTNNGTEWGKECKAIRKALKVVSQDKEWKSDGGDTKKERKLMAELAESENSCEDLRT